MLEKSFPSLHSSGFIKTSPFTHAYNCIAWAASDSSRWWWPDKFQRYYWPPGVLRAETIEAFIAAFTLLGYINDSDDSFDPTLEKIAIYALNSIPTHAARQISPEWWSSKLGDQIDISHKIDGLDGPVYGNVVAIRSRPKPVQ